MFLLWVIIYFSASFITNIRTASLPAQELSRLKRQMDFEFWPGRQNRPFQNNFQGNRGPGNNNNNADNIVFWDEDNTNSVNPPRFNGGFVETSQTPGNPGSWGFGDPFTRSSTTPRSRTSTLPVPGMGTTRSACEDTCRATTQFDPVCGDNMVTYTNMQWLRCAQNCGRRVEVKYRGACPRFPTQ